MTARADAVPTVADNSALGDRVAEILAGLLQLTEPNEIHELRVFMPDRSVGIGFFNDPAAMAHAAARFDDAGANLYRTLNPVKPELFKRSPNCVTFRIRATHDDDILRRRWFPVDIEPVRRTRTAATDDELGLAIDRANDVWLALRAQGWPEPRVALSGNGIHLLTPIDIAAADDGLVARILHGLDKRFSDRAVKIDTSVSNAARIMRCYGTVNHKGVYTTARPHRRSMLFGIDRWR